MVYVTYDTPNRAFPGFQWLTLLNNIVAFSVVLIPTEHSIMAMDKYNDCLLLSVQTQLLYPSMLMEDTPRNSCSTLHVSFPGVSLTMRDGRIWSESFYGNTVISILSADPTTTCTTSRLLFSLNAWDYCEVCVHKARLLVSSIQHPRIELSCYWHPFDPVKENAFCPQVQLN